MSVVRRGSVGAVVAGLVLLGGPAWAQGEDPCAPGPDGSVPEMCQSGPAEPVSSDTGTVDVEPDEPGQPEAPLEPCPPLPVEPGDGVVSDEDRGVAVGEPDPGAATEPGAEPEPAPQDEPVPAPDQEEQSPDGPAPVEQVYCIAASGPVADGAPESAAGGGSATNDAVAVGRLPRTGPYDRALATAVLGAGLLVVGAGAAAAGRRRTA